MAFLLICTAIPCEAQTVLSDSLYHALPNNVKPKSRDLVNYVEIGEILLGVNVLYPSAPFEQEFEHLATVLDSIANHSKDVTVVVRSLYFVAFYTANKMSDPVLALVKTKELLEKIKGQKQYEQQYFQLCAQKVNLLVQMQRNEEAFYAIPEILKWAKQHNEYAFSGYMYLAQSQIYSSLQLYERSIEAASLSETFFNRLEKEGKDSIPNRHIFTLFNNAECYINLFRTLQQRVFADTAKSLIDCFRKRYPNSIEWNTTAYRLLATLFYLQQDYPQANMYFDSATWTPYLNADIQSVGKFQLYLYKGLAKMRIGRLNEGKKYIDDAIEQEKNNNNKQINYIDYYELYKEAKDRKALKEELKYLTAYSSIKDSVNTIGQRVQLFQIQEKFDNAQKVVTIKNLQSRERLKSKQQMLFLTTSIIIVLLLLLLIVIRYNIQKHRERKSKDREQNMQKANIELSQQLIEHESTKLDELYTLTFEQQKSISEDMHNELGSGLTALRYYIGDLRLNAESEPVQQLLKKIEDEAQHVYVQTRDYIHALNENAANIKYDLMAYLNYLSIHFDKSNIIQIKVNGNPDKLKIQLTTLENNELYFILKEAVTNVLKHARASHLWIDILLADGTCTFHISDNGIGMKNAGTVAGIGLSNIKARLGKLGGDLTIQSGNEGTTLTGSFPVSLSPKNSTD